MALTVVVRDEDGNDEGHVELVDYVLITNDEAGYYLAQTEVHANGTTVLTVKRDQTEEG